MGGKECEFLHTKLFAYSVSPLNAIHLQTNCNSYLSYFIMFIMEDWSLYIISKFVRHLPVPKSTGKPVRKSTVLWSHQWPYSGYWTEGMLVYIALPKTQSGQHCPSTSTGIRSPEQGGHSTLKQRVSPEWHAQVWQPSGSHISPFWLVEKDQPHLHISFRHKKTITSKLLHLHTTGRLLPPKRALFGRLIKKYKF